MKHSLQLFSLTFESIVLAEISALDQQEDVTKFYNNIQSLFFFCMVPLMEGIVFREKTTSQLSAKLACQHAGLMDMYD